MAVREHFSKWGAVADVYFPRDKATGERKPFCFVAFEARAPLRLRPFSHHRRIIYLACRATLSYLSCARFLPSAHSSNVW